MGGTGSDQGGERGFVAERRLPARRVSIPHVRAVLEAGAPLYEYVSPSAVGSDTMAPVNADIIQAALADITAETDPTLKHLMQGAYGLVRLVSPEDLLVERVLISVYPQPDQTADQCARKLIAVGLTGQVEIDWVEVQRLAQLPEYRILPALIEIVGDVANELGKTSPYSKG